MNSNTNTNWRDLFAWYNWPMPCAVYSTLHNVSDLFHSVKNTQLHTINTIHTKNSKLVKMFISEVITPMDNQLEVAARAIIPLFISALKQTPGVKFLHTKTETVSNNRIIQKCIVPQLRQMAAYAYVYKEGNIQDVLLTDTVNMVHIDVVNEQIICTIVDKDLVALTFESMAETFVWTA